MYEGHLSDGSGIQKHSAGGLYPYVVYAQGADVLAWGVIVPGQAGVLVGTYDEAVERATTLKHGKTVRANGQNFRAGQVVRVSGHGWCDAKGVIQQLELAAYQNYFDATGFRALVQRHGGLKAVWIPLADLSITH